MNNEELKNQFEGLKDSLRDNYNNTPRVKRQRNILIIIILLLMFGAWFGYQQYQNLRVDLNIAEQNQLALADSVRVEKNKVGDLEYSRNILVAEKGELENLSQDLAEELDKEKGKVHQLTKYVVELKNQPPDTVKINNTLIVYADGSNGLEWEYDTIYNEENSRSLAGVSKFHIDSNGVVTPLETEIKKDEIKFNIVQGLREKDGNVEMFVRSDYPGFSVGDLESAIIDPYKHPVLKKYTKKKRWGLGPFIGGGLGVNMWPSPNVGFGVMVGVSVHYSLIQF
jgi:hypothetical protein